MANGCQAPQSVSLPFTPTPPVRAFTYWAYYFSVLEGMNYDLSGILYNHFIPLTYIRREHKFGHPSECYVKNLFEHEFFDMQTLTDPVQHICFGIQNAKYAVVVLNAKHISSVNFDRDWLHDYCIFGFDDEQAEFYAAGYVVDTSCHALNYKFLKISYADFVSALPPKSVKTGYEGGGMNYHFFWLPKGFAPETVNLKKVKRKVLFYGYNIPFFCESNTRTYQKYCRALMRSHKGNDDSFDLQALHVLQEHKQIIHQMMQELSTDGVAAQEYQRIVTLVNAIQMTALKYNITKRNKQKLLMQIDDAFVKLRKEEPIIMREFYHELKSGASNA